MVKCASRSGLAALVCGFLVAPVRLACGDSAGEYIATLPWEVDLVAPKFTFVGGADGPAAYCGLPLPDLVTKVLRLNEDTGLEDMAAGMPFMREFLSGGGRIRNLFAFAHDIMARVDNNRERPRRRQTRRNAKSSIVSGANVVFDPDNFVGDSGPGAHGAPLYSTVGGASIQESIRTAIVAAGLAAAGGKTVAAMAESYSAASPDLARTIIDTAVSDFQSGVDGPALQKVQRCVARGAGPKGSSGATGGPSGSGGASSAGGVAEGGEEDTTECLFNLMETFDMDALPDQVVGWGASRTVTELLSTLFTDSWLAGVAHDTNKTSLGDALCRATEFGLKNDFMPEWSVCSLLAIVFRLVGCANTHLVMDCSDIQNTQIQLDQCDKFPQTTLPDGTTKVETPQFEFLPRADAVDPKTDTLTSKALEHEGTTLWSLEVAGANHGAAMRQRQCEMPLTEEGFIAEVLPGWPIVHEVWLNEEATFFTQVLSNKYVPFTSLTKKAGTQNGECEFLQLARGTQTDFEWFVNLNLGFAPVPMTNDLSLLAHSGYVTLATPVANSVNQYLTTKHFELDASDPNHCDPQKTTMWFFGHSLGGGMTNTHSLLFALYWKSQFPGMVINSMATASLRVFNEAARDKHAELVNPRNFRYDRDLVPNVPCLGTGIPRCDPAMYPAGVTGAGVDVSPVANAGEVLMRSKEDFSDFDPEEQWYFNDNKFLYAPGDLPLWMVMNMKNVYINIPTSLQLGVAHGCSYPCFLSSRFCSADPLKQSSCRRRAVNSGNPQNCMNGPQAAGNIFTDGVTRLGSLDCSGPQTDAPNTCLVMSGISGALIKNFVTS